MQKLDHRHFDSALLREPYRFDKRNQPVNPRPSRPKASRLKLGSLKRRAGKIKYGCLAWLIGLPLPIVILLMFYKGCDF